MVTLHIGVINAPYTSEGEEDVDTGEVATWLENRYGILESFVKVHGQDIADALAGSVRTHINAIMTGATPDHSVFGQATSDIQADVKKYISSEEVEHVLSGMGPQKYPVPTKAALEGVRHRFKDPKNGKWRRAGEEGVRRPSFIDTGMYEGSLISWVDE